MSKRPQLSKPYRKFDEEEGKYTDRLAYQTDRLVEQSMNSDISFSKDESYSITNLKQDWDSIKLLQQDIKKTSEKLKQLGGVHARPLSECGKALKHDKKSKTDPVQAKELKKLQEKVNELNLEIAKYEKERNELISVNEQLREDLSQSLEANSELKKQLNSSSINISKKTTEIMKYAQFITKKIKDLPKWDELFIDRMVSASSFLVQIKANRHDDCLLSTLQFLSDLIVQNSQSDIAQSPYSTIKEQEKNVNLNEESESLLITINAQSERIAKLNKQISEAMISSKELLYSPLAPVIKKEIRASKSSCFTPNCMKKKIFGTPEKWKLKKDAIQEITADEEMSGKP